MRGIAILALTAAALVASSSGAAANASSATSLKITFWPAGPDGAQQVTWTLRCNPARGTLRNPAPACRKLASGGVKLFAPVPRDAVCTEIYGGPQVARVVGTVGGKRIWARFSRANGCHIARWDRLSPWLLPRGGVT